MDNDRQTGKTTKQMRAAPYGAMYVWVNDHLKYPNHLALKIGRDDLEIIPPSRARIETFLSRKISAVVVDHAAHLNHEGLDAVQMARDHMSHNAEAQLPPERPQAAEGTQPAPAGWAVNCSASLDVSADVCRASELAHGPHSPTRHRKEPACANLPPIAADGKFAGR